jgi:hypothetical protein
LNLWISSLLPVKGSLFAGQTQREVGRIPVGVCLLLHYLDAPVVHPVSLLIRPQIESLVHEPGILLHAYIGARRSAPLGPPQRDQVALV